MKEGENCEETVGNEGTTMATTLRFGNRKLDINCAQTVIAGRRKSVTPLSDPIGSVQQALADPMEFPPLDAAVMPDDRVVIVVQSGIACAPELVAGVVRALLASGSPAERIAVLRSRRDRSTSAKRLLRCVDQDVRNSVEVLEHDASDPQSLSFLGASEDDQPVLINRALFDADVVIPVGMLRDDHVQSLSVHHSWFPDFADRDTQRKFRKSQTSMNEKRLAKRRRECEEAARMLGVLMTVQLVPAGNNQAVHVLAGSPDAVWKAGVELNEAIWRCDVRQRASLVVLGIGGGRDQQTWHNVARAVSTAVNFVEDDGAIAVCSQLHTRPGPALRRLASSESFEAADRAIRSKLSSDNLAATRLNAALQSARVYLLSELDEQEVEDLGLAYVANAGEISKLCQRHASCLVLEDAQFVSVPVETAPA